MTYEKFCPECDESIEIPDFAVQVTCIECQNEWYLDTDAEFVDGMWRDLTALRPVDRTVPLAPSVGRGPETVDASSNYNP